MENILKVITPRAGPLKMTTTDSKIEDSPLSKKESDIEIDEVIMRKMKNESKRKKKPKRSINY